MVKKTTDYTGRSINLMLTDTFEGQLKFIVPQRIITGIQKVVQSFVVLLLTAVGSKIVDSEDGSVLASEIVRNGHFTEDSFFHIANIAISEVLDTMIEDQDNIGITRTDERISAASILSFAFTQNNISLNILIETEAGSNFEFVLPIKLPITSF